MSNRKKPYEKPTLKGVDMLETGAGGGASCCKTTTSTCTVTQRTAKKKQTSTVS